MSRFAGVIAKMILFGYDAKNNEMIKMSEFNFKKRELEMINSTANQYVTSTTHWQSPNTFIDFCQEASDIRKYIAMEMNRSHIK